MEAAKHNSKVKSQKPFARESFFFHQQTVPEKKVQPEQRIFDF